MGSDRADSGAEAVEAGDTALRYMDRFGCIGPDCEDTCCHTWRVHVDDKTYDWLELVTRKDPELRAQVRAAFRRSKRDKKKSQLAAAAARRGKAPPIDETAYYIKMGSDGYCTLYKGGICSLHATLGSKALPNVCAIYPRRVNVIGDRHELSGTISCPEVARQLLLHEDAVDIVPWDHQTLDRPMISGHKNPRDVRPYWRLHLPVRRFIMDLLLEDTYPLRSRLQFLAYFANRTNSVLSKGVLSAEESLVRAEMDRISNPAIRAAVDQRFDKLETPSAMVLLLSRALMGAVGARGIRNSFADLARGIFGTYEELEALLPEDSLEGRRSEELTQRVFEEYNRRRDECVRRAGPRIDLYMRNFAVHWWFHRLHFESRDVLVHTLRCLAEMALMRFMLFSHPEVFRALRDGGDESEGEAFEALLDRAAVDVFYNVGRSIEHSPIMTKIEAALAGKKLDGVAGAVFLVRF